MDTQVVIRPLWDARWTAFVANHPYALPFHHPSWAAMLAECYRFRAFSLTVDGPDGQVLAGVPVVEVPRRSGGYRWVALPFTDHCPPLVSADVDVDLSGRLDEVRRAFGVHRLELRADVPGPAVQPDGAYLTHVLRLDRSEAEVFAALHGNQVRRNIRRAERAGVTVRQGTGEADLTGVFYRLHVRTRHRLGVPVQPRRYFRLLWERVVQPGHGAVLISESDGVPVAAGVFLASRGVCVYKYGASDERSWRVRPNHLLFWHAIRWAMGRGCTRFDFGRTDAGDTGLRQFKSYWGTVERPLAYSVLTDRPNRPGRDGVPGWGRAIIRHGPAIVPRAIGEPLYRYTA
jgi:CelD/BcsL family acetyltransferase involved in cellulose biosynthesis